MKQPFAESLVPKNCDKLHSTARARRKHKHLYASCIKLQLILASYTGCKGARRCCRMPTASYILINRTPGRNGSDGQLWLIGLSGLFVGSGLDHMREKCILLPLFRHGLGFCSSESSSTAGPSRSNPRPLNPKPQMRAFTLRSFRVHRPRGIEALRGRVR